jgi:hypothetical protein
MQQDLPINGTLDTSFIRHERSECLINECLEKFIKELHTILFELTKFTDISQTQQLNQLF